MDTVEIVMTFEEKFEIKIPDAVAEKLITPRLCSDLIEATLISEGRPRPRTEIDEAVRAIIFGILGVTEPVYHPDAEFIRDLGAD